MIFRFLTSGESHGKCLNAIIEGVPAGVSIDVDFINNELRKRQVGYGRGARMSIEADTVKINSGVRLGKTLGSPICLEITNKDWENWQIPMSVSGVEVSEENVKKVLEKKITNLRPGHADFAGAIKYDHYDIRNILERSSARETAARVAVGAFAKAILNEFDITCFSHVTQIGSVKVAELELTQEACRLAECSDLRCIDSAFVDAMKSEIDLAKEKGETLGGSFEVIIKKLPVGLGSHVHWDRKLDGLLAQAIMSIPAVKSVEIGLGSGVASKPGSETHDEIYWENGKYTRKTNNAGGIEGGMTNGEDIVIKASMKAIPTMKAPLKSVNIESHDTIDAHFERSDVCAVPACGVVAESMAMIVIVDAFLQKFGSDNLKQIKLNYKSYLDMLAER